MQRSTSHDSYIRHKGSVLPMGIEGTNGDAGSPNLHRRRSMVTGEPKADSRPISLAKTLNKKEEGFLDSNDVFLRTLLFPACIAFLVAAYATLELSDTLAKLVAGGMPIALIAIGVLTCLNSSSKNCESVDGFEFQIVKWLLLPVVLFSITLSWTSLCLAKKIPIWFVCALGSIIDLAILYIWYRRYYIELPKILKGINEDSVGEDRMFSSPV